MLSEEEKEAIKIIERIKKGIKIDIQAPNVEIRNIAIKKVQAIDTVLNIITKLQQENEELKKSKYVYGIDMDFDYIQKQKIRDRVEELKDMQKENANEIKRNTRFYSIYDSYNLQINELLDLLEEE